MRRHSLGLGFALTAAFLACTQPDTPFRLSPYEFRRIVGADTLLFHWPASSLPVRFYAEPAGQLPAFVRTGIGEWQRTFLYGEFRGVVVDDSTAADIIVRMDGPPPPDRPLTNDPPRAVCAGVTSVPPTDTSATGILQFATPFTISVHWFPGADSTDAVNCLARVTTHEIGHALGIFAHSNDPLDLMYQPPTVTRPSLRDQSTIQTLYHLPTDVLPWSPTASAVGRLSGPMRLP